MKDLVSLERTHSVETIRHREFERVLQELLEGVRLCNGLNGGIIPFLGPTKIGKREVLHALRDTLGGSPVISDDLFHDRSFVTASIPVGPTDTNIRQAVLKALDLRTFSTSLRGEPLRERLELALEHKPVGQFILFNCHHLLNNGGRLRSGSAADLLRSLSDAAKAPMIVVGLPQFQRVIDGSAQLRDRALNTIMFTPYRWSDLDDQEAFVGTVLAAFQKLEQAGYAFDFDDLEMSARLYGVSGGRVGVLARIIDAAVISSKAATLSEADFRRAAERSIQKSLRPARFFENDLPTEDSLAEAYMSTMHDADLRVEIDNRPEHAARYGG